jgi:transposase-like protein
MGADAQESVAVLRPEELQRLVGEAVSNALAVRPVESAYLDVAGAATYLGVTQSTVARWLRKGLPSFLLPPTNGGTRGVRRFCRGDLDRWVRQFRVDKRPGRGRLASAAGSPRKEGGAM